MLAHHRGRRRRAAALRRAADRRRDPYGSAAVRRRCEGHQPGGHGGQVIELPETLTFGLPVDYELMWEEGARERVRAIPSFARGMVVKAVEAYARRRGDTVVTRDLLADVRARWGARFRPHG